MHYTTMYRSKKNSLFHLMFKSTLKRPNSLPSASGFLFSLPCQQWSSEDKELLVKMGKIAFDMLERNTGVFTEEDINECGLSLTEVTVFSGICTELPTVPSEETRKFCFIHFTFQVKHYCLLRYGYQRCFYKNLLTSSASLI